MRLGAARRNLQAQPKIKKKENFLTKNYVSYFKSAKEPKIHKRLPDGSYKLDPKW
jgi:hypothetical protein